MGVGVGVCVGGRAVHVLIGATRCVGVCVEGAVHVGAGLGEPIFASHIIVRI